MEEEKKEKRVNIRITKEEYERIKRVSELSKLSITEIAKRGMREIINNIEELDKHIGRN